MYSNKNIIRCLNTYFFYLCVFVFLCVPSAEIFFLSWQEGLDLMHNGHLAQMTEAPAFGYNLRAQSLSSPAAHCLYESLSAAMARCGREVHSVVLLFRAVWAQGWMPRMQTAFITRIHPWMHTVLMYIPLVHGLPAAALRLSEFGKLPAAGLESAPLPSYRS